MARTGTVRRRRPSEDEAPPRRRRTSSTGKAVSRKGDVLEVNFEGVGGRGRKYYNPGYYGVKVVQAKMKRSANKETPQLVLELRFKSGEYKGQKIEFEHNLLPQSLWVLRRTLEAMGREVPEKLNRIKLSSFKDEEFGIQISDDPYRGKDGSKKVSSKITDAFPSEELEARLAMSEELDEDEDEEYDEEDEELDEEDDDEEEDADDEEEDEDEDDLEIDEDDL